MRYKCRSFKYYKKENKADYFYVTIYNYVQI